MNNDLVAYYQSRAAEYEKIYHKPERQADLQEAATLLQNIFAGKEVLEIACGTGYWTEKIGASAKEITATDINESVIEIARTKNYSPANVEFSVADLYDLSPGKNYESLFGGFIWSHILLKDLDRFLEKASSLVKKGGTIVFMDNNYVEGSSTPISFTDCSGNTFQTRQLENGETYEVLKNFPSEAFLRSLMSGNAAVVEYYDLGYFWMIKVDKP